MHPLEHIEALILMVAPILGIVVLVADFSSTNFLLVLILLVIWKHANGAL